jgi:hypothetical protein
MIFHSPRALREVCPKHRNNRREIPAGASFTREAAVFVLFVVGGAGCAQFAARAAISRSSSKSRMPGCQPGDAGAIAAISVMVRRNCAAVSLRSAPADRTIFQITRRAPACAAETRRDSAPSGRSRSRLEAVPQPPKLSGPGAAPGRRATFTHRGGARWEGSGLISRQPSGFDSRPRHKISGPLDHSGGHPPRTRERPRDSAPSRAERLLAWQRGCKARCKAVAVHHFQTAGRLNAGAEAPCVKRGAYPA